MEGSRNNRSPLEKRKLSPRKIAPPPPHELICKFFLVFNFYFCGNFRLYVKSIFIPFSFLIINKFLYSLFFYYFFPHAHFFFDFNLWHYIEDWRTMLGNVTWLLKRIAEKLPWRYGVATVREHANTTFYSSFEKKLPANS